MLDFVERITFLLLAVATVSCAAAGTSSPKSTPLDLNQFFTAIFHQSDLNNDSKITFLEFEQVWKAMDVNGDNSVTTGEYSAFSHNSRFVATELFKFLDQDHNNRINLQESPRIFREYDSNADGIILVQEFVDEYWRIYNFVKSDITSQSDEGVL